MLNPVNCTNCARQVIPQAKFCSYCGERLAIPCPSCETLNASDALFCHNCGGSLAGHLEPAAPGSEGPVQPEEDRPRCPRCSAINEPASTYCFQCGLSLEDGSVDQAPCVAATRAQHRIDFRIPLWRVLLMSLLSAGLYMIYWFYLTWEHYRDSTDDEAYPVWHALALCIPIYGLFRAHAHMQAFRELMIRKGIVTFISPAWAIVAVLVAAFCWYRLWDALEAYFRQANVQASLPAGLQLTLVCVAGIAVAWLLLLVQSDLNRYWDHVCERLTSTGFSVMETALAIAGGFVWYDSIAKVVS